MDYELALTSLLSTPTRRTGVTDDATVHVYVESLSLLHNSKMLWAAPVSLANVNPSAPRSLPTEQSASTAKSDVTRGSPGVETSPAAAPRSVGVPPSSRSVAPVPSVAPSRTVPLSEKDFALLKDGLAKINGQPVGQRDQETIALIKFDLAPLWNAFRQADVIDPENEVYSDKASLLLFREDVKSMIGGQKATHYADDRPFDERTADFFLEKLAEAGVDVKELMDDRASFVKGNDSGEKPYKIPREVLLGDPNLRNVPGITIEKVTIVQTLDAKTSVVVNHVESSGPSTQGRNQQTGKLRIPPRDRKRNVYQ